MKLTVKNETGVSFAFKPKVQAQKIITHALSMLSVPFDAEIFIRIVDKAAIREINREYRGKDSETDVISFPMIDYDEPLDFSYVEKDPSSYLDPETGSLFLGDIVLCAERIFEQADEFGHSILREFDFLVIHSLLHLFGYDHETDDERIVMEKLQEKILTSAGITR